MGSKEIGTSGEEVATGYLKEKGYKILHKNWRIKQGELDIVAKHKKKIIFVEVKTLQPKICPPSFLPEDEVNQKKKRQLVKMAQIYLLQNRLPLNTPHQIDILAIELINGQTKIRHFENAIEDTP